jgi:hypothetical protein
MYPVFFNDFTNVLNDRKTILLCFIWLKFMTMLQFDIKFNYALRVPL